MESATVTKDAEEEKRTSSTTTTTQTTMPLQSFERVSPVFKTKSTVFGIRYPGPLFVWIVIIGLFIMPIIISNSYSQWYIALFYFVGTILLVRAHTVKIPRNKEMPQKEEVVEEEEASSS